MGISTWTGLVDVQWWKMIAVVQGVQLNFDCSGSIIAAVKCSDVSFEVVLYDKLRSELALRNSTLYTRYRVARTHRIPYLYSSFSAKKTYI